MSKRKRGAGPFECEYPGCRKVFSRSDHLARHRLVHDEAKRFPCSYCDRVFTRPDVRKKHEQKHEPEPEALGAEPPALEAHAPVSLATPTDAQVTSPLESLSPDLVRWLMRDDDNFREFNDSMALLKGVFGIMPEFSGNYQTDVDDTLLLKMIDHVPALEKHPGFTVSQVKLYLETYWNVFHSQYPILHRPSFSTFEAHPLLLLSVITMGAASAKANDIANLIAEPLRWQIFGCEEAKPACKAWVIQSLVILEMYELTKTTRTLHERACIYNGVKLQLLRRSPILGGDPMKAADPSASTLWKTWIESESMKRAAWMSFYVDTMNAIVYGHPVNLFANQINLSLPCSDGLWENSDTTSDAPLFSDALKKLLRREPVQTGAFGRKILLAGLLNLSLQTQGKDSLLGYDIKRKWSDTISSALNAWRTNLGSCTAAKCFSGPCDVPALTSDSRCKFPEFHSAKIHMGIMHYDYIVYAGAPKRMNVPILPEDYEAVVRRVSQWANAQGGRMAVVNAYILLCEMLVSPSSAPEQVNFIYDPNKDPFLYRPNVVISATLALWAFAFHLYGPESHWQAQGAYTPAMEDACSYLRRIRGEFHQLTGCSFESLSSLDSEAYGRAIGQFADAVPHIKNINNLVGLLSVLSSSYKTCQWETGREYGRLLANCIRRSMGSEVIFCADMYET